MRKGESYYSKDEWSEVEVKIEEELDGSVGARLAHFIIPGECLLKDLKILRCRSIFQ